MTLGVIYLIVICTIGCIMFFFTCIGDCTNENERHQNLSIVAPFP